MYFGGSDLGCIISFDAQTLIDYYNPLFDLIFLYYSNVITYQKALDFSLSTYNLNPHNFVFNPLAPDSAKSTTGKIFNLTKWAKLKNKQHHSKVLVNNFPMNDHTLGFCP